MYQLPEFTQYWGTVKITLPLAFSLVVGVTCTFSLTLVSPTMLLEEESYPVQVDVAKLESVNELVVVFMVPLLKQRSTSIPEITLTLSGLIKFEIEPSKEVISALVGAVSAILACEEEIIVQELTVREAVLLEQLGLVAVEN